MATTAEHVEDRAWRDAVDASPAGLALFDAELVAVRVNAAFARVSGREPASARGLTLAELLPQISPQVVLQARLAMETERALPDIEMQAAAPSTRRWSVSCSPTSGALAITVVELPVRSAESAALESDAIFREIFDEAGVGMIVLDWRTGGARTNRALQAMLRYSEAELLSIGIKGITHPDDFAADLADFQRLMAAEIERYAIAKRYVRKDGGIVFGQVVISLVRDAEGAPRQVIGMIEDITERRQVDAQREKLIAALEDAVRAREVFVTIASHELKTPLTALKLLLQMMRRRVADARLVNDVDGALRQTDRLVRLVQNLLDVSRVADGRVMLKREPSDVAQIARDVVARIHFQAERAGCSLDVVANDGVMASVDRSRIDQVIANLLDNAIKFGSEKAVDVSVALDGGGVVRVSVCDHGLGVPPSERERIFGRFERAVAEHSYGGLGLGLYISREIVVAHGGSIRAEETPGGGATFVVELPAASP